MSENIAGYIDRSYIKGQYYRYAAAPKPVNYSGNIDEISADLLTKAMLVTRGSVGGTLPNDFGNTFLITTLQYGTNTYLQTAYVVQTGYECWEYRRIYSGTWTAWIGVDSSIKSLNSSISKAQETADAANNSIKSLSGDVSNLSSAVSTINNSSLPGLSGRCDNLEGRCSNLETVTSSVSTDVISECINCTTSNVTISYAKFSRFGRICQLNFSVKRTTACGKNGYYYNATLGSIAGLYLPVTSVESVSYSGYTPVYSSVNTSGAVTSRNCTSSSVTLSGGVLVSLSWFYNGTL